MASSRCLSQDHPYSKVESNGSFTQAHLSYNRRACFLYYYFSVSLCNFLSKIAFCYERVTTTNPITWVSVLLHLKCSYLVLSLKASAKVQQFSEPPKLFRSFFLKNYRNRLQYIIFNDSTPYYYIIT